MVFADLTLGRWGVAGASVTMASAIMLLKIFVAFLQAFIFAMLTAVFIGLMRHAH
jgi:F-type H+-transporting ATPase subunit a